MKRLWLIFLAFIFRSLLAFADEAPLSFDFAVDWLSVDGNITGRGNPDGIADFFDDFDDGSLVTPPTSEFFFHQGVSSTEESGGFLRFKSSDGTHPIRDVVSGAEFLADSANLGPLLRDGAGNSVVTASFRPDTPSPGQFYSVFVTTVSASPDPESVTIQVGANDAGPFIVGFVFPSRVGRSVPVDLSGAAEVLLRLKVDDITNRVVPSFSLDGGHTFTEIDIGGAGTVFSTGPTAFVALSGSVRIPLQTTTMLGPPGSTNRAGMFAEPVNTATGNYIFQRTDIAVPGRGFPLTFTRTYNSHDETVGPFGRGWTHSYHIRLQEDATGTVSIKWGDGHEEFHRPLGTGEYEPLFGGVFSDLLKQPDESFLLAAKDQTRYHFSSQGNLTRIEDRNSNQFTFTYDSVGNLVDITDAADRRITLTIGSNDRITSLSDAIGRTVQYGYDTAGNLTSVTNPDGGIMTFSYDENQRLAEIQDERGNRVVENTYDLAGRVVAQRNGRDFLSILAYDTPGFRQTTITDPRGNKVVHTHDPQFRLINIADAAGGSVEFTYDSDNNRTSVTSQNGQTTNFSYDIQGNITGIADALGSTISFTYDGKNNLLSATNAKGRTTTFDYDSKGNLIKIVDALGSTNAFGYDSFGQLTLKTDAKGNETNYSYDSHGNLIRITDAPGNKTNLAYDGIGRLLSITDPNGRTATAAYDVLSRLVEVSDPLGNKTKFEYDAIGNLTKIIDANGNTTGYSYDAVSNLQTVTDALGGVTRYEYDQNNNRIAFVNAKGHSTAYEYDALNRLTKVTDPLSFATSYQYDAVGNLLAATDAKDQRNQFAYDALNRLIEISYADGNRVEYAYDTNGNRIQMTDFHGTTTYTYDALDRLVAVNHPGGKVVGYSYDAMGNRTALTYPDGKTANYVYDEINRLALLTDWLGRTTTYSYDAGNLIGINYPNQTGLSFSYDAANRLIQVQNHFRGARDDDDDPNPISRFNYVLDAVGNRLEVTDGDGKAKLYAYDALYQLIEVKEVEEDDDEGDDDEDDKDEDEDEDDEDDEDAKATQYNYDAVGNRLRLSSPGTLIDYTYDAGDRLVSAEAKTPNGKKVLAKLVFEHDANGNLIRKLLEEKKASQALVSYRYDAANRLIAAAGDGINSAFSYDGDGNRVIQSTSFGTYQYLNDVATALPVVLEESGPDGDIAYAYGLGLISAVGPTSDFLYHYDGLGSVVGLTDARGRLFTRYSYDSWGNLTLQTGQGQVSASNKFLFTGQALDPDTELYYLRARYYDAMIGRMLARDPFEGFVNAPETLNRYTYTMNNPIRFTDRSGLAVDGVVAPTVLGAFNSGAEFLNSVANDILVGLSKGGPIAIGAEIVKSAVVNITADTLEDLGAEGVAQDIRDLDTLLTPFGPSAPVAEADQRIGPKISNVVTAPVRWFFRVFEWYERSQGRWDLPIPSPPSP